MSSPPEPQKPSSVVPKSHGVRALWGRIKVTLWRSRFLQIGLIIAFWALGTAIVKWLHLPVPGGIVGLVLVLVLLASGWMRLRAIRRGAYWLLGELLLFFAPAMLVVLDHHEFVGLVGLKIMAVILVGTILVMAGTALTVDLFLRWHMRRVERRVDA